MIEYAPASFGQEGLWLLDRLQPGNPAYIVPIVRRLHNADPAHVEQAVQEIVRRHDALRSFYVDAGGGAAMGVRPDVAVPFEVVDLRALEPALRLARARRLTRRAAQLPFDLAQGPPLRALLVRVTDNESVLVVSIHHIVCDHWSVDVFRRELDALLRAFAAGRPSPLPELPVQYGDFARDQRRRLAGEGLEAQLDYWRQRLADAPRVLELPADRPRPPVRGTAGAWSVRHLGPEVSARLAGLARTEGVTLYTVLLAAFKVLLHRYSGQEDLVVGSPIAGRHRTELEPLIGYFINTLPLRTELAGEPSFRELVHRVKETVQGALANQDVPVERLIHEFARERSMSTTPLYQVMFMQWDEPPRAALRQHRKRAADDGYASLALERPTAKFDLTLHVNARAGEETVLVLEYATELFDSGTASRMLQHFAVLAEAAASAPDTSIGRLPLLTAAERHRLLVEWNQTAAPPAPARSLAALFEAQVRRTPDAVAVIDGDDEATYAELNRRANQLAHVLRGRGAGPGTVVGLHAERSLAAVVAILGVLKAGAAYLPLDASYPKERVAAMLEDAGVSLVLAGGGERRRLPAGVETLAIGGTAGGDESDPPSVAGPDDTAFVLFTSGSTGRPKGVPIAHRAYLNRIPWAHAAHPFGDDEVFCLKTSLSHVDSVSEVFDTLTAGRPLVVVPDLVARDPERLVQLLARHRVTRVVMVPSLLRVLLDEVPDLRRRLPDLWMWIPSGEALSMTLTERFRALMPGATLVNWYGATEVAGDALWFDDDPGVPARFHLPLGRPIHNVRAYVLDRHLEPVPVGVPGELYLSSPGTSAGYLRRPDLTAERFVPDPFANSPGARLYRTGDLVRYLPDGCIEALGRLDDQVKIRGFRVEPAEVEAALVEHPSVRQAVVAVRREDGEANARLVGYVVAAGNEPPSVSALREHLKARLPEYAIPAAFVFLDALPLNPNGKLDRLALPAPVSARPLLDTGYVAPRTEEERVVAAVWEEVLGVSGVGADDNFFELGGHSLLGTQILSRIRDRLGFELPLWTLFDRPTVAGLAAVVASGEVPRSLQTTWQIDSVDSAQPQPLSHSQLRHWFFDQLNPGGSADNIATALRFRGALDVEVLARALNEVVRRHEVLRTSFPAGEGEPRQVVAGALPIPIRQVSLAAIPAGRRRIELGRLVRGEVRRPFDLARGPLLRAALYRMSPREHVLLVTLHHIVGDAWSLRVLTRELRLLHAAFAAGGPSPLDPLPFQFSQYSAWQRSALEGGELERQLGYWRERLADAPRQVELATDRPRPAVSARRGARRRFAIDEGLLDQVTGLARASGATPFMVLFAAWAALLHRYSGQDDIVCGTPLAGRGRTELEQMIGPFVNTIVLRVELRDRPSFAELLRRVAEAAVTGSANADLPFERLVEELAADRDPNQTPLFNVVFQLLDLPPDAEVRRIARKAASARVEAAPDVARLADDAKFDLNLRLARGRGRGPMSGSILYDQELWDPATIERLARHYVALLRAALADPAAPVSDLEMLDAGELAVIEAWTGEPARLTGRCLHEQIAGQARRTPDAVAVVFEPDGGGAAVRLTYRELDQRANRLARHLRALGVGPEVVVGLHMPRSADLVVAVLAILKAGGGYLGLDPAWPRERIRLLLSDSEAPVVVTVAALADELPEGPWRTFRMDADWPQVAHLSPRAPAPAATTPLSLAYVISTSGSTGQPKGVVGDHRGLDSYTAGILEAMGVTGPASYALLHSLSVDAPITFLYGALVTGGTLHVISEDRISDAEALADYFGRHPIDYLKIAPPHLAALLASPRAAGILPRRLLLVGGEALHWSLVARVAELAPECAFLNHYGPTETTCGVSTHPAHLFRGRSSGVVPLGRPLRGARIRILDRSLRPVPAGVVGEIHIGGPGVTRGYLKRPQLTAERFIPDPFAAEPGARLYRTGDLGRFLADGTIEYCGRSDNQVKIRGFRVELGEVEAVLGRLPAVREVVVVAREQSGERRLVAYVVPRTRPADGEGLAARLRNELLDHLPGYMVPSAIVLLEKMPLTSRGKLDRRALPEPEPGGGGARPTYVAPATPTEERVAAIWSDLLRTDRLGVHDDFFALGGHSLLAMQAVSRMREQTGAEVTLLTLFQQPTVAEVAAHIDATLAAARFEPAEAAYRRLTPGSRAMNERAQQHMPGGTTRTSVYFEPYPLYLVRGAGCRVWDVDGTERLDMVANYTSLILGHAHPAVISRLQALLPDGTYFGGANLEEIELAAEITRRVPSIERVRFVNSGTEATMYALRLARAFTGRPHIARVEGGYHGSHDLAMVSSRPDPALAGPAAEPLSLPDSPGIPEATLDQVVVIPFNDEKAAEAILRRHRDRLAAVIVEPVLGSAGAIPARPEYLQALRRVTEELGILLVFDEVITFRLGPGGAQELYGVRPDLTTLGKLIGGGLPVGAFGGRADVMALLDPRREGSLPQAGSFFGHRLGMAAGHATLSVLDEAAYAHLDAIGEQVRSGLREVFADHREPVQVTGAGSLFQVHFTADPVTDYRGARRADPERLREFFLRLVCNGAIVNVRGMGALSLPVGQPEVELFLEAVDKSLSEMRPGTAPSKAAKAPAPPAN